MVGVRFGGVLLVRPTEVALEYERVMKKPLMKGLFLWGYSLAMREAPLANLLGLPKVEALFAPIIFVEK